MQRGLPQLACTPKIALACALALIALGCAARKGSIGAVLAKSHDDGKLTVRDVPTGLAAARAGLEPGDEVLSIDGRDPRPMTPEQIHLALEGDVGSRVRVTVLRRGRIERLEIERAPLRR